MCSSVWDVPPMNPWVFLAYTIQEVMGQLQVRGLMLLSPEFRKRVLVNSPNHLGPKGTKRPNRPTVQ